MSTGLTGGVTHFSLTRCGLGRVNHLMHPAGQRAVPHRKAPEPSRREAGRNRRGRRPRVPGRQVRGHVTHLNDRGFRV